MGSTGIPGSIAVMPVRDGRRLVGRMGWGRGSSPGRWNPRRRYRAFNAVCVGLIGCHVVRARRTRPSDLPSRTAVSCRTGHQCGAAAAEPVRRPSARCFRDIQRGDPPGDRLRRARVRAGRCLSSPDGRIWYLRFPQHPARHGEDGTSPKGPASDANPIPLSPSQRVRPAYRDSVSSTTARVNQSSRSTQRMPSTTFTPCSAARDTREVTPTSRSRISRAFR